MWASCASVSERHLVSKMRQRVTTSSCMHSQTHVCPDTPSKIVIETMELVRGWGGPQRDFLGVKQAERNKCFV